MCMGPDPKVLQVGGTTTAILYFTNGEHLSATPSAWSTTVRAIERPDRRNVSTLVPIMALAAPLVACGQAPPWYRASTGRPGMEAPSLAGRPVAILENRLAFFASGHGNAIMRIIAGKLTVGERNAVARYVSRLPAS